MSIRQTRTYAILEITKRAFTEIATKLRDAGYNQAFHENAGHGLVIDMHGIAVATAQPEEYETTLWAKSIFGHNTRKGLVEIEIKGAEVTCSPTEARAFAYSLLEAAEAADTDEFIMTWLQDRVGVKGDEAAFQVLREFREKREEKRKQ